MPRFIDTHTHVQFPAYRDDREAVIQRALDAGIWMVNIGTHAASSEAAISLAEKYPEGVSASVGFHPGHVGSEFHPVTTSEVPVAGSREVADTMTQPHHRVHDMISGNGVHDAWENERVYHETFNAEALRKLAAHPKVVGIGECGLDYYRDKRQETRDKQKEIFEAQIDIAKELKKPLIIHCRDAFSDLIEILSPATHYLPPNPGVVHFFSGTVEDAKHLADLGFYFGFGGVVTFAKGYYDVVRSIPLDRIVLETDAPYVAPVPYRGKRNEPLYIEATAAKIAEWKSLSIGEILATTTHNARTLFNM